MLTERPLVLLLCSPSHPNDMASTLQLSHPSFISFFSGDKGAEKRSLNPPTDLRATVSVQLPPPKPSIGPPPAVPVVHSSAYVVKKRREVSNIHGEHLSHCSPSQKWILTLFHACSSFSACVQEMEASGSRTTGSSASLRANVPPEAPFTGNAIEYILRKGDDALNGIEGAPNHVVEAVEKVIESPGAKLASGIARKASTLTVKAAGEVLVAGLPVAKTVMVQGLTVAGKVLSASLKEQGQRSAKRRLEDEEEDEDAIGGEDDTEGIMSSPKKENNAKFKYTSSGVKRS